MITKMKNMLNSIKPVLLFWQKPSTQDALISQQHREKHNISSLESTATTAAAATLPNATNLSLSTIKFKSNIKSGVVKEIEGYKFSFRYIYFLLFTSLICMFTLSFMLHSYVKEATDIKVFQQFLKSDFVKDEVEIIVQKYLNKIKKPNQDATTKEDYNFKSSFEYR
jgi:hypothetical protein